MSSFFHQQAQIMMSKHIDSYPLLKINRLLDWQPIEQLLNRQKTRYIRDQPRSPRLSATAHAQSRIARPMAQPFRSGIGTLSGYPRPLQKTF